MKPEAHVRFDVQKEADRIVLNQYAPAGLVVNENLQIVHFRGQSSPYLSPPAGEAGESDVMQGGDGEWRHHRHQHSGARSEMFDSLEMRIAQRRKTGHRHGRRANDHFAQRRQNGRGAQPSVTPAENDKQPREIEMATPR